MSTAYAVHEAGHAVVGLVLGLPLIKVSLHPAGSPTNPHSRGTTHWAPTTQVTGDTGVKDWAGPVATRYMTSDGEIENENDADIVRLGALAWALDPDSDPMILAQEWYLRAHALLSEHSNTVYRVAEALDLRGSLTAEDVNATIRLHS